MCDIPGEEDLLDLSTPPFALSPFCMLSVARFLVHPTQSCPIPLPARHATLLIANAHASFLPLFTKSCRCHTCTSPPLPVPETWRPFRSLHRHRDKHRTTVQSQAFSGSGRTDRQYGLKAQLEGAELGPLQRPMNRPHVVNVARLDSWAKLRPHSIETSNHVARRLKTIFFLDCRSEQSSTGDGELGLC